MATSGAGGKRQPRRAMEEERSIKIRQMKVPSRWRRFKSEKERVWQIGIRDFGKKRIKRKEIGRGGRRSSSLPNFRVRIEWSSRRMSGKVRRVSMLNNGFFLLNFAEEEKKVEVLLGGPWTFDNRPLILKEWSEHEDYKSGSVASLPVWVRLPAIKAHLMDPKILSRICSKLGRPICTDGVTAEGTSLSFARVCVEVYGEVELEDFIEYEDPFGNRYVQSVLYEWRPPRCSNCCNFGHLKEQCTEPNLDQMVAALKAKELAMIKEKDKREAVEDVEELEVVEETPLDVMRKESDVEKGNLSSEKRDDQGEKEGRVMTEEGESSKQRGSGPFQVVLSKSAQKRARQREKRSAVATDNGISKSVLKSNTSVKQNDEVTSRRRQKDPKGQKDDIVGKGGGDFNCILNRNEKRNGAMVRDRDLEDLQKFVNLNRLVDLEQGGSFYSWNNNNKNPDNRVWSKLDRAMGNESWFEEFQDSKAIFSSPGISYHSPILISWGGRETFKKHFRYCRFWEELDNYKDCVEGSWRSGRTCNNLFLLQAKLKKMKGMFKEKFVKETVGLDKRVDEAREHLLNIQKSVHDNPAKNKDAVGKRWRYKLKVLP
ncbi:hypothetical protein QQ045_008990 [Rhodiola kirilowii]